MDSADELRPLDVTRREFLQIAASVTAVLSSADVTGNARSLPARNFEHGDPLREFEYGDVHFAPGLHQTQLEQTHAICNGLDEDGLFRPFRMAAGLPAPGRELGGWHSSLDIFGPESRVQRLRHIGWHLTESDTQPDRKVAPRNLRRKLDSHAR